MYVHLHVCVCTSQANPFHTAIRPPTYEHKHTHNAHAHSLRDVRLNFMWQINNKCMCAYALVSTYSEKRLVVSKLATNTFQPKCKIKHLLLICFVFWFLLFCIYYIHTYMQCVWFCVTRMVTCAAHLRVRSSITALTLHVHINKCIFCKLVRPTPWCA